MLSAASSSDTDDIACEMSLYCFRSYYVLFERYITMSWIVMLLSDLPRDL